MPRSALEIEITEEAVMTAETSTRETIAGLRAAGLRVSLDDFGRGYSNLTRLADLCVDSIKIDGPLSARVASQDRVRAIIKATVEMAEGLGCETVAEGVETAEQANALIALGCTHFQGYFFARPMDVVSLNTWIETQEKGQVRVLQEGIEARLTHRA